MNRGQEKDIVKYMNRTKIKKSLLVVLASLAVVFQSGCADPEQNVKKAVEVPMEDLGEEPPVTPETEENANIGEQQGPKPQAEEPGARETMNPEPPSAEEEEKEDPDHHPEPPPGEEYADAETDGSLSPPSGSSSIFGGNQGTDASTDEALSTLLSSLPFPSGNGSWSVYVCNLEENTEGMINEHRMQAASLIKLYIMGAVYENYDSLAAQYGRESLDANLRAMITVSDNDAANALTDYLGGGDSSAGMQAVNNYCSDNGYMNTHMGRLLLQSNQYDDNYTSAADCGHFLKMVYDGWMEGNDKESAMFELLAAQQRRNKIPAQMPSGVGVANKTGELADVENDAGIIYYSDNDLVIVFMSENLSQAGAAQSTIASLSRQIYDYYQQ